ncbi:MAG: hypothetical protein Q8K72_18775, partial [Acidimicrobiales bacterium]|nr:hypothetical protein [Acidimicrobiales bacterium]
MAVPPLRALVAAGHEVALVVSRPDKKRGRGNTLVPSPVKAVAQELKLDWHTVKELEKKYMLEQLRRAGTPGPKIIGVDEVSVRKGHTYRIVVSDLIRERPI